MHSTKRSPGFSFLFLILMLAIMTPVLLGHHPPVAHAAVTAATPDFTVTVSPLSQTRKRGTGAPYFVTITPVNGFNGTVTLSLSGDIPANCTVLITQPGLGPLHDGEVDLQIEKHSILTGTFAMTIHAISGTLEHDVNISLTIV